MTEKAKYVCAWTEKGTQVLQYKYRGHFYTVQDFGQLGFPLASQHRQEQARIDGIIEIEKRAKEHQPTADAQESFDYFWDYVNNKEEVTQ